MASLRNTRPEEVLKNYFKELKFVLKLVGVSLEGNESVAYKVYSFTVLFSFNIAYLCLDFVEACKQDFEVVADTIFVYFAALTMATIKVCVILRNRIKFGKLLSKLEREPFTANPDRGGATEEKLIKECVWITYIQTLTFWITGTASLLGAFAIAFSSRLRSSDYHDWDFAYGPLTALNVTYSPNYEISVIYQSLCVMVVSAQFISTNLIEAAVMAHISYQFKIVQNNIRRLVHISYEKMLKETGSTNLLLLKSVDEDIDGSAIPWKHLKVALKEAVNYHLAVINIAEGIETIFSGSMLVVFLSTLGILCVSTLRASMVTLDDPQLARRIGEELCVILQVATVCYWGEQVLVESEEVGRAAYESNFVGTDLRFQKSLVLIIRRSQNPTILTAGKFCVLSLPTLAWIIQTSYSAFTMLRNMHQIN